jgi:hypothetical protein
MFPKQGKYIQMMPASFVGCFQIVRHRMVKAIAVKAERHDMLPAKRFLYIPHLRTIHRGRRQTDFSACIRLSIPFFVLFQTLGRGVLYCPSALTALFFG